jgi:glycosyltransferase involved in cell wall biosynthesis
MIVRPRLCVFVPSLVGGGAERVALNFVGEVRKYNLSVDLVVGSGIGELRDCVPANTKIFDLSRSKVSRCVGPFIRYLKQHCPSAVIAHMTHTNVIALGCNLVSRARSRVFVVEHTHFTTIQRSLGWVQRGLTRSWVRILYPRATKVIAVSEGVRADLLNRFRFCPELVRTLRNPIVTQEVIRKSKEEVPHRWLDDEKLVVYLGVGRLKPQKDFQTLIRAFARLGPESHARLIILGDGELRHELEKLCKHLGVGERVELTGFVHNPYALMRKAKALVLSSRYEGLPTVIIEALACGTPVISTRCPSGPEEILREGTDGFLVRVGDDDEMARAMREMATRTFDPERLISRGMDFSVEHATREYLRLVLTTDEFRHSVG